MANAQKTIPLNQIKENPVALRGVDRESEKYLGLVDSVRSMGILNPINVREKAPDSYELVDGLHRFSAAKDAGLQEIPVQVLSLSDAQVYQAQVMANLHKVDTKPVEYSRMLLKILSGDPTMTEVQLAAQLCKSTTWVADRMGLLQLSEEIQPLVDEGKIGLANAYNLAKLPKEEQRNFVEDALSKPPQEFVPNCQKRVKEIKDAKRQGRDPNAGNVFKAIAFMKKLSEIQSEIAQGNVAQTLVDKHKIKKPSEAFNLALQWVLNIDSDTIALRTAEWDKEQADRKAKKEEAAAERQKKKAEEASALANTLKI